MASPSRSALITRTVRVLKKHYNPAEVPKDRSLLEHLLFACLLENSPHEAAEQVFTTLQEGYFDWNEVRVSTVRELTEAAKPLIDAPEAAARLKQTLHSVFEAVYQFDLEPLKKQNIGQAVKQLQKYNGTTPFVVSYVTQTALGGHSIPVSNGLLTAFRVIGVISDGEAQKGVVPGLERAVSKKKGVEYGSLLHQLGVEVGRNPYGPTARALLLEISPQCKDRLPKRPTKRVQPDGVPPAEPAAEAQRVAKKEAKSTAAAATGKRTAKPPAKAKKKTTKKPAKAKKRPATAGTRGGKKKTTSRRLTKRKPK